MGRLAPTPSGHLHLGNALAFGAAWISARAAAGRLLVRIEDVDTGRARPEVASAQLQDLEWLGLDWDERTADQSTRDYRPWLHRLDERTYHCQCSRSELREVAGRCGCVDRGHPDGSARFRLTPGVRTVEDGGFGAREVDPTLLFPDPVLRRRDGVFAYNLAVVADDIADGVTEVVRGGDLLDFAAVQAQIWEAFGATPPTWTHTPMALGHDGHKLSKSHGSTRISALRDAGWSPGRVWDLVLPWMGMSGPLSEAPHRWRERASWARRPTLVVPTTDT